MAEVAETVVRGFAATKKIPPIRTTATVAIRKDRRELRDIVIQPELLECPDANTIKVDVISPQVHCTFVSNINPSLRLSRTAELQQGPEILVRIVFPKMRI
jgi:hypothetical protein